MMDLETLGLRKFQGRDKKVLDEFLDEVTQMNLIFTSVLADRAVLGSTTDCKRPVRKSPSLHGRKSDPHPKFLGTAEAYFVCHIGPKFQISLIYAFIGCP